MNLRSTAILLTLVLASPSCLMSASRRDAPAAVKSPQERLLDAEFEYLRLQGSGLGPMHPIIRLCQAQLDTLNQIPEIRNETYWKLLEQRKTRIRRELAQLKADGLAARHPAILSLELQLATSSRWKHPNAP